MKVKSKGGRVDLRTWELDSFDDMLSTVGEILKKDILRAFEELLRIGVEDGVEVGLSSEGLPRITVWLPFEEYKDQFSGPQFDISADLIFEAYKEGFEDRERGKIWAKEFRDLADRIESYWG